MHLTALPEIVRVVLAAQRRGQRVVLANGAFDLLHVGHLRYLEAARAEGDMLVVAINTDASVRRAKGPERPIVPEHERLELVLSLRCVDHAVLCDDDTVEAIIRTLTPDVHAKGRDYTELGVPEGALVRALGGRVAIVGDPKDHSTTRLAGVVAAAHRAGAADVATPVVRLAPSAQS